LSGQLVIQKQSLGMNDPQVHNPITITSAKVIMWQIVIWYHPSSSPTCLPWYPPLLYVSSNCHLSNFHTPFSHFGKLAVAASSKFLKVCKTWDWCPSLELCLTLGFSCVGYPQAKGLRTMQ
jgi:hypothetical protein